MAIIECPICESRVDAKILAEKQYSSMEDEHCKLLFLECPLCDNPMVGRCEFFQVAHDEWAEGIIDRLWPAPAKLLHHSIPRLVQKSLEEAETCWRCHAYAACAVMCGRAIEGICRERNTKAKMLAEGLKELKDQGVIDQRLFDWGKVLQQQRNIGAHPDEEEILQQDARDVLDFALAICDYVYVLSTKYDEFMERQNNKKKKGTAQ